jgi:hypothetical protein
MLDKFFSSAFHNLLVLILKIPFLGCLSNILAKKFESLFFHPNAKRQMSFNKGGRGQIEKVEIGLTPAGLALWLSFSVSFVNPLTSATVSNEYTKDIMKNKSTIYHEERRFSEETYT